MILKTICAVCHRTLILRHADKGGTVKTLGACCTHTVGLPAAAGHPVRTSLRRSSDRRSA